MEFLNYFKLTLSVDEQLIQNISSRFITIYKLQNNLKHYFTQ